MNLHLRQSLRDTFSLTYQFMHNLRLGHTFTMNKKSCRVKSIGVWKSSKFPKHGGFKTLTIQYLDNGGTIKFYFFFGIEGNPASKQRNASAKQHQFMREVEGVILLDTLNLHNPFHELSDIYRIATENQNERL